MFFIDQPYSIVLIASIVISLSLAVAVLLQKRSLGVHAFAALQTSVGLWAFSSLFEIYSQDMPTKLLNFKLKFLFIVIVPISWFIFGLYYSNRLRSLRLNQLGLLCAVPILTLILVATNESHHWMFTSVDIVEIGPNLFLVSKFGLWFWIHAAYCYILLFLGFLFMAKQLLDSPSHYRWQVITLLVGGLTPWVINIIYVFKLVPSLQTDLTPFAFTISGIAFMWGIIRFQLLDVDPIAHNVIIQNIEDAIIVVDGRQRIVNINRAAEKLMDLLTLNPIGNRAAKIFSWWPEFEKTDTESPPSSASNPQIIEVVLKNQRLLLRLKQIVLNCNQREIGMLITLSDVTDTLIAKEALLISERRFRSLSENAPVIIFALDTNGGVTYINPAWEKILGRSRDDILGKPFMDLVADNGESVFEKTLKQLINGHMAVAEMDVTIAHTSGTRRLFNASLAANADNKGCVTGIIGMAKDITEERKLQQQLFQSQKMEAIGTLAGGVAHDFNNLLMGMQANLSLMRLDDPTDTESYFDKIQRIENQIQSGASLTRQLLGYARKGQYVVVTVDINRLIEDTLHVVQRANKRITVQSLLSDNSALIKADRGQIEMVLLNLFLNAVDAMPQGGRLTVSCRQVPAPKKEGSIQQGNSAPSSGSQTRCIEIVVADTGIGMDQATQDRIFEPFFTTKEVGRGSGLGLASVYGVVHNHGGTIQVESAIGQGTTFTLFFPAVNAKIEDPMPNVKNKIILSGSGRILLVEDELLIQKYCMEMIKSLNFEAVAATDGYEAIEIYKAQSTEIDLVILDMIMPGMDGVSIFKALHEINPHLKVIITSGYAVDRRMSEILASGPHGYLKKPYTLDELFLEIADTLKRRNPQKKLFPAEIN